MATSTDRKPYPSDLSDAQWAFIEPLLPPPRPRGRPRSVHLREVFNAILYLSRTGCSWRQLPYDLPPWGTVHWFYRQWRLLGLWPKLNETLREQVRLRSGRRAEPSAAVIDSQSVKTTEKGGLNAVTTRVKK